MQGEGTNPQHLQPRDKVSANCPYSSIALIENGEPVLGVVWVPALNIGYSGVKGDGALKYERDGSRPIHTRKMHARNGDPVAVVASRSHGADAATGYADTAAAASFW